MDKGLVTAICRSDQKGTPKRRVDEGVLRPGHGLEGDAHAGPWHRQLSLLDDADIRGMEASGLKLAPGAFGENLVVSGINTLNLGVGSRLAVGEAEIRITQIGKECHDRCAIYDTVGDCIMPRLGLFAEVVCGGRVRPGTTVTIIETRPRTALPHRPEPAIEAGS